MTRKQRRSTMIFSAMGVLGLAVGLVLFALSDGVTFFYTPSDIITKKVQPGTRIRLGGMVENDSIKQGEGTITTFVVTDKLKTIKVSFNKILPDLFREGQGVVTEGRINMEGIFVADTVLAKHDENYMPKEVADAMAKQGAGKREMKSLKTQ